MKVYEVGIGQKDEVDVLKTRRVHGPARNALEAAEQAKALMAREELLLYAKPLYELDWIPPA
jgi:hypothetical protein